ncbi:MAG TPA: hypothetical protein VF252_06775 [Gemmatimonadales bacterium]
MRDLLLCLAVLTMAGCDIGGGCTLGVEPGLRVEVRDRATGGYISPTPRGVAREGTYQDSLEVSGFSADVPPRVSTMDGWVPVGRYTVHLAADGYQPWDSAGVQVEEGGCGIETTRFTAALQPVP